MAFITGDMYKVLWKHRGLFYIVWRWACRRRKMRSGC